MTDDREPYTLSVAPMMDWTDRHCRFFHRLMTRHTLLYTEMITAKALIHGDRASLLAFHPAEHPLALQLGGSIPSELGQAAAFGAQAGYDEINLNAGCPSERVQSGYFGAALMKEPLLAGECARAMIESSLGTEVTVKCRIGVDDQVPIDALAEFIQSVGSAGVKRVAIHARKAWLKGLSPKENREIPPLDYGVADRMRNYFPELKLVVNGGIGSLETAEEFLERGFSGAMIGRAAYRSPGDILLEADRRIFGSANKPPRRTEIARTMLSYAEGHVAAGGRLSQVLRHLAGLFNGIPGSRHWKRCLAEKSEGDLSKIRSLDKAIGSFEMNPELI
ncbi:MAG: tRNA dihydrouridine(20/20a) synthase DusA [Albidovulum sp.]|nr:tRNA dihydrouridine(20/20a) synthase DusA [Albidovulum sp.]MDE0303458.1 tRNA dihydrouridine(20/20a) synthase DusA [Albidovulum sp.]MDE0532425.1 tRNA dihydrouridine(20/20a) synthase DusA [Albidovulum sp.]